MYNVYLAEGAEILKHVIQKRRISYFGHIGHHKKIFIYFMKRKIEMTG